MKLIFKKSVKNKLFELIHEAVAESKEIEKIILTENELDRLKNDCRHPYDVKSKGIATFMGYPIEIDNNV
jgi:hypothetical protein